MRRVITAQDVPPSGELRVPIGTIVTPSAREVAQERGVRILELPEAELPSLAPPGNTVAIGSDHRGFQLKETLKTVILDMGFEPRDMGIFGDEAADYPDIAEKVAGAVMDGRAFRGVAIDGAGIGSSIAANKLPGIRAALCYDKASARNSREHNDSNVLTLGASLLTPSQAEEVLRTWLGTRFAGGRHAARVEKIAQLERRYMK